LPDISDSLEAAWIALCIARQIAIAGTKTPLDGGMSSLTWQLKLRASGNAVRSFINLDALFGE
jgi:hypothetical protein